jgi:glycosyltransferase involved in cell wall biosynthesis
MLGTVSLNNCAVTFVYERPSTFVLQDLKILSHLFRVVPVRWIGAGSIVKLMLAVLNSDAVFVRWMTGQAVTAAFLFAKAFRKSTVFVAGGSEVAVDSDIHGRDPRSVMRFVLARIIIRFVDCVLPVSEFTLRQVLAISAPKRYRVVYNAVDTRRFTIDRACRKTSSIVTVASNPSAFKIKGLDRYARLSQILREFKFYVVGPASSDPRIRRIFPPEACLGSVSQDELAAIFRKATFYCQLSRYESFGLAVAEAMACGCVPVVSDGGALPETVGDCGFVVPNGDPLIAAQLIRESLAKTRFLGSSARRRVLSRFSIERRTCELRNIILTLVLAKEFAQEPDFTAV